MRFYLDTSIWLDFLEKRGENGESAFKLIQKIIKQKNIRRVYTDKENIKESRQLCWMRKIPLKDALHAILARDNEAMLISRDRHFEKIKDISITYLPEDFI